MIFFYKRMPFFLMEIINRLLKKEGSISGDYYIYLARNSNGQARHYWRLRFFQFYLSGKNHD